MVDWIPLDVTAKALVDPHDTPHDVVQLLSWDPISFTTIILNIAVSLDLLLYNHDEWLADPRSPRQTWTSRSALKFFEFIRKLIADAANTPFRYVDCEHAVSAPSALREVM